MFLGCVNSHFSHHPIPTLDEQLLVWGGGGGGSVQCKVLCMHKYLCFREYVHARWCVHINICVLWMCE